MYIVRFQGGLGNQMFQYAFMKALQKSYPDTEVLADLTPFLEGNFHYGFELERVFGIKLRQASRKDIIRLSDYIPMLGKGAFYRLLNILQYKVKSFNSGEKHKKTVIDNWYGKPVTDLFKLNEKDLYFDDFWQGEPFYKKALPGVLDDFTFDSELYNEFKSLLSDFATTESVAVHVRRGDYVNNPNFPPLTKTYYLTAMQYILEQFPKAHFYLFSDDPDYCEVSFSYIKNRTVIHSNLGVNSYKDMFLMSQCRHNIIANSSFSYWAAVLNKNPHKTVVSPVWMKGYCFASESWFVIGEK